MGCSRNGRGLDIAVVGPASGGSSGGGSAGSSSGGGSRGVDARSSASDTSDYHDTLSLASTLSTDQEK